MRVVILTSSNCRSPRFLAEGLGRMLAKLGIGVDCFPLALKMLYAISTRNLCRRNRLKASVADIYLLLRKLDRYDAIIVSDTVSIIGRAEILEPLKALNRPLLHYEVFAYQGSDYWLQQFGSTAHHVFDGFLTVSGIHDDQPLLDKPIFEIGMDLPAPQKFDYQRPFSALLDFPRKGYELERKIQKEALQFLKVPIIELDREYTFREIDDIYSQVGIAFIAFPEAFGLPIVQLQYHGAYIASPRPTWIKRHALRTKGHVFDPDLDRSAFTDNFILYDSKEDLIQKLSSLMQNFNPWQVRKILLAKQANFVHGNLGELSEAMRRFSN
jgi:hypothetical protein